MNGFIVVNKPKGITSSTVVVKARRILNVKKIGHLGTLDPDATGVLPLAVGTATRLFDYFLTKQKRYTAGFVFGVTTDTLDASGKVTEVCEANFDMEQLEQAVKSQIGEIDQVPPAFSAKSVGGVRSYDLARRGEAVDLPPKRISVFDYRLISVDTAISPSIYYFDITCSGGTYIRAIVRDTAKALGTVGHMVSLVRTEAGMFSLGDAVEIEDIAPEKILPVEKALGKMPVYEIEDEFFKEVSNGVKIDVGRLKNPPPEGDFVLMAKNQLFGIATVDEKNRLILKTNLRTNLI